jgi:hypothetical protein
MMEQTEHQVTATAIDPSAAEEKENAKLDMEYRMKFKEALSYIDSRMGIDRSGDYVPDTIEELNSFLSEHTLTDATLIADIEAWRTAHGVTYTPTLYNITPNTTDTVHYTVNASIG